MPKATASIWKSHTILGEGFCSFPDTKRRDSLQLLEPDDLGSRPLIRCVTLGKPALSVSPSLKWAMAMPSIFAGWREAEPGGSGRALGICHSSVFLLPLTSSGGACAPCPPCACPRRTRAGRVPVPPPPLPPPPSGPSLSPSPPRAGGCPRGAGTSGPGLVLRASSPGLRCARCRPGLSVGPVLGTRCGSAAARLPVRVPPVQVARLAPLRLALPEPGCSRPPSRAWWSGFRGRKAPPGSAQPPGFHAGSPVSRPTELLGVPGPVVVAEPVS